MLDHSALMCGWLISLVEFKDKDKVGLNFVCTCQNIATMVIKDFYLHKTSFMISNKMGFQTISRFKLFLTNFTNDFHRSLKMNLLMSL